jgi:hypothetical protein
MNNKHGRNGKAQLTPDGVPLRRQGLPPLHAHEMLAEVAYSFDVRVRVFDLHNPDDLKAYEEVWDKVKNGFWVWARPPILRYNRRKQTFVALLHWAEVYGEISQRLAMRLGVMG